MFMLPYVPYIGFAILLGLALSERKAKKQLKKDLHTMLTTGKVPDKRFMWVQKLNKKG